MSDQTTVTNPRNGDIRVIPAELVKQYRDRGWVQDSPKASKSDPK